MLLSAITQLLKPAGTQSITKLEEAQSSKHVNGKEGRGGDSEDDEFDPDKTLSEEGNVSSP